MIPLVASMADVGTDAPAYVAVPAARDEFSGGDEPLSWDADGWDEFA